MKKGIEGKKQKPGFKSYYCADCKQTKLCEISKDGKCCQCRLKIEEGKAAGYLDYQEVYQAERNAQVDYFLQLQLLKDYRGCPECGSLEIDFWEWEEGRLVCQPCRIRTEGGSSGSISLAEKQKWYKKQWGIDLAEWLENFTQLPVNAECARKWLKDKKHLANCQCLERQVKSSVELFTNSLREIKEKIKNCQCEKSKKVRVGSDDYGWCESCEKSIFAASKKRVIKNRNDPRFWGLELEEKVLCGGCLESKRGGMSPLRRAKFNEYRKLGML